MHDYACASAAWIHGASASRPNWWHSAGDQHRQHRSGSLPKHQLGSSAIQSCRPCTSDRQQTFLQSVFFFTESASCNKKSSANFSVSFIASVWVDVILTFFYCWCSARGVGLHSGENRKKKVVRRRRRSGKWIQCAAIDPICICQLTALLNQSWITRISPSQSR